MQAPPPSLLFLAVKALPLGLLQLLAATASLPAQIYADFTVSHGTTALGTFRAQLPHDKAPRPVANFIGLATGQRPWVDLTTGQIFRDTPFYDGTHFQRLVHDFVIQGGDPPGLEGERPGYFIQDQYHPDLRHSGRYILSMAKSSLPHTTKGQFFITLSRASVPSELEKIARLDDKHSVFGEVIDGKSLIDNFADPALFPTVHPGTDDRPQTRINLDTVVISGPSLASFDINDPALRLPTVSGSPFVPDYDPVANEFTLTWDRADKTDYILSLSPSLESLSRFRNFLSLGALDGHVYTLSGVPPDRFFGRLTAIDYSLIPNAPAELNGDGSVLVITNRNGDSVTLTFDGAEGGTWSDSLGNSGTLSAVSWFDGQATVGVVSSNPNFPFFSKNPARLIPIGGLLAEFDSPAGSNGWISLGVNLSFHEDTTGFTEGSAEITGGATRAVQQAFLYTP